MLREDINTALKGAMKAGDARRIQVDVAGRHHTDRRPSHA